MKPDVWFNAVDNEIIVRIKPLRFERGEQGIPRVKNCPPVPDYLNLFTWKANPIAFKQWKENGWLIRLGYL